MCIVLSEISTFCGTVAVVGLPSVGKSMLVNSLCKAYVSGISDKPQFTQKTIRGICTKEKVQVIFLDSPGFVKENSAYHTHIAKAYVENIKECDCVLFVCDASKAMSENELVILKEIAQNTKSLIIALNKRDLGLPCIDLLSQINQLHLDNSIVLVSAKTRKNIPTLFNAISAYMPRGIHHYPSDYFSDQHPTQRICECVRESLFFFLKKELPYATYVEVAQSTEIINGKHHVRVALYVEKKSQIPILVGEKGILLQKIRMRSEQKLALLFPKPIFLHLTVQLRKNWRKDTTIVKKYLNQN